MDKWQALGWNSVGRMYSAEIQSAVGRFNGAENVVALLMQKLGANQTRKSCAIRKAQIVTRLVLLIRKWFDKQKTKLENNVNKN